MSNRLAGETSTYLLQHADNPVDWYPWGQEALDAARTLDRPVFVSIGYSSCHWCHVMAHESFEDEGVAALMNATFVNVKVDREELPHIDHIYMQACQLLTGSGGWPLTVIMTPDGEPFFTATYLPRHSRQGLTGMMELIPVIGELWREKRDRVVAEASEITRLVRRAAAVRPGDGLKPELIRQAYDGLKVRHDPVYGGFGDAPKFPMPHTLMFLMRYFSMTGETHALSMAVKALESMRRGGIYDHVDAGFHRYATDREWLVPHFEKMLYDQALLAISYAEAFQATGRSGFRKTAEDVLDYVLRDLRTDQGLFASSRDADSDGSEGRFYLWTLADIDAALDEPDAALAREAFGLRPEGNAPGLGRGLNIIHIARDPGGEDADPGLHRILGRLGEARTRRVQPQRDATALTDWNGLMIAALARCSTVLDRPDFADAAGDAADFILDRMAGHGRLSHVFRSGQTRVEAGLDDYVFLIWGLIELYEATFEQRHLDRAVTLTSALMDRFWDTAGGGFFSTAHDIETPIARAKTAHDSAIPAGNAVAMLNLLRLADLTGDTSLTETAVAMGKAFSPKIQSAPSAYLFMLCALAYLNGPATTVSIAGDLSRSDTRELIEAVRGRFLPHAVIRLDRLGTDGKEGDIPDRATARVCTGSRCMEPTTQAEIMLEYLSQST